MAKQVNVSALHLVAHEAQVFYVARLRDGSEKPLTGCVTPEWPEFWERLTQWVNHADVRAHVRPRDVLIVRSDGQERWVLLIDCAGDWRCLVLDAMCRTMYHHREARMEFVPAPQEAPGEQPRRFEVWASSMGMELPIAQFVLQSWTECWAHVACLLNSSERPEWMHDGASLTVRSGTVEHAVVIAAFGNHGGWRMHEPPKIPPFPLTEDAEYGCGEYNPDAEREMIAMQEATTRLRDAVQRDPNWIRRLPSQ